MQRDADWIAPQGRTYITFKSVYYTSRGASLCTNRFTVVRGEFRGTPRRKLRLLKMSCTFAVPWYREPGTRGYPGAKVIDLCHVQF
eukprot:13205-Rhodomonas_salina.2